MEEKKELISIGMIQSSIEAYNKNIENTPGYLEKQAILTSEVMHRQDFRLIEPSLNKSNDEWCKIDEFTQSLVLNYRVHQYEVASSNNLKLESDYNVYKLPEKIEEQTDLLKFIVNSYFTYLFEFSNIFPQTLPQFVISNLQNLKKTFELSPMTILSEPLSTLFISRSIKAKKPPKLNNQEKSIFSKKMQKILPKFKEMLSKGKFSIREICRELKISVGSFYNIRDNIDRCLKIPEPLKIQKAVKSYMLPCEFQLIKELVKDSRHCYSVRDIANELFNVYGLKISNSTLYYHMTHTLRFSYKVNSYKPPVFDSFKEVQERCNVALKMLDLLRKNVNIIAIDECGIDAQTVKTRSFCGIGVTPHRICSSISKRINILMAMDKAGVLCYVMRLGSFDSLSFADFLIQLAKNIYSENVEHAASSVIFMDNVSFHHSKLIKQLIEVLGLNVIFNAARFSLLNPIEQLFSVLKPRIKSRYIKTEYF